MDVLRLVLVWGLAAWSAERGMSRALCVGLVLLGETGGRLEELSGRMEIPIPALRLNDPLGLLREGNRSLRSLAGQRLQEPECWEAIL